MNRLSRALALCALICLTSGCIFSSDEAPRQPPDPVDSAPDEVVDQPDTPADQSPDVVPDTPPPLCDGEDTRCGEACVDLSASAEHCGACERSCGSGECVNSACVCPDGAQGRTIGEINADAKEPLLRLIPYFHSDAARAADPASAHYLAATLDVESRIIEAHHLNALGAPVAMQPERSMSMILGSPIGRSPAAMEAVPLPDGALFAVVMRSTGAVVINDEIVLVRMSVNHRTGEVRWVQINVDTDDTLRGVFGGMQLTLALDKIVLVTRVQDLMITQEGGRLGAQRLEVTLFEVTGLNKLEVRATYESDQLNDALRPSQGQYPNAQYPLRLHVEAQEASSGEVESARLGVTFCQEQVDRTCDVTSHVVELKEEERRPVIIPTQRFLSGLSHPTDSNASKIAYGLGASNDWSFFGYYLQGRIDTVALQTADDDPLVVSEVDALSALTLTAQQTSDLTGAGDLELGWLQQDNRGGARGYHASWRFLAGDDAPQPGTLGARALTREGALSQLQSASATLPGSVLYVAIEDNAKLKSWSVIDGQAACEPLTTWPAALPMMSMGE